MRHTSGFGLFGVLIVVVILLVVAVPAVLVGRARAKRLITQSRDQPFAYGQPMSPVPGSEWDFGVDVVGLPGVVSVIPFIRTNTALAVLNPLTAAQASAGMAAMGESRGRVHIKVPLGPDWPNLSILVRGGAQQIGGALARSMGTAGTEIVTGDPTFDGLYKIASGTPDPRPVLAVVNPQVREMVLAGRVTRWLIGGGMWIEAGYSQPEQRDACIDWTIRLATLIVTSSGIPVVRPGPPPGYGGGQVPA